LPIDKDLAALIASLSREARDSVITDIPRFIAARQVTKFFHFTSFRNLNSIVKHGFLGRDSLKEKNISAVFMDQFRSDPILDGICFSMSRPNHYMAASKTSSGHDIVLLELQNIGELLTSHNFISSPGNFGSYELKQKIQNWPESFIGGEGLINLFQASAIREKYGIPDHEPTDPRAEIVILEPVAWSFVKKIYFPSDIDNSVREKVGQILRILPIGCVLESKVEDVFPSIDWKAPGVETEYRERQWSESWNR